MNEIKPREIRHYKIVGNHINPAESWNMARRVLKDECLATCLIYAYGYADLFIKKNEIITKASKEQVDTYWNFIIRKK